MTQVNKQYEAPFILLNPKPSAVEKTVVVIGCSRGGTSMVAGTLRELDVFMGERFTGANHEDIEFTTTNINILKKHIARRNATHKIWGWKYPHVIEYFSQIVDNLRNPYLVFVFRNILDVAKSYAKYHQRDHQSALLDSYARYSEIVNLAASCQFPSMLISFEKALDSRHDFVDGLINFFDLEVSSLSRNNAIQFINQSGGYKKASFDNEHIFLNIQHIDSTVINLNNERKISYKDAYNNLKIDTCFVSLNDDPQILYTPNERQFFPSSVVMVFDYDSEVTDYESRLYIDFGSGFYAMASQAIPLRKGLNVLKIQFETNFYRLRFDPLNKCGNFTLKDVFLYDAT